MAILGNATFDVRNINPNTVLFANAQPLRWAFEDVDDDGDIDILLHFRVQEVDMQVGDKEAILHAELWDEYEIVGADAVKAIGKCGSAPPGGRAGNGRN